MWDYYNIDVYAKKGTRGCKWFTINMGWDIDEDSERHVRYGDGCDFEGLTTFFSEGISYDSEFGTTLFDNFKQYLITKDQEPTLEKFKNEAEYLYETACKEWDLKNKVNNCKSYDSEGWFNYEFTEQFVNPWIDKWKKIFPWLNIIVASRR
jgi:hypothetical protein